MKENYIKDAIDEISGEKLEKILDQMNKCICKIEGKETGTGFFCKIEDCEEKIIPVLITSNQIIDNNFLEENNQINITINGINKAINIDKDTKIYSSDKDLYDITILRIKENLINNFLELDSNIEEDNSINLYKNESIYILHYPEGKNKSSASFGYGIEKYNDYYIKHLCKIKTFTPGAPILNLKNNKVIGIHKGYIKKKDINDSFNLGTFIKYPLKEYNYIEMSKKINVNSPLIDNIINAHFGNVILDNDPYLSENDLYNMDNNNNTMNNNIMNNSSNSINIMNNPNNNIYMANIPYFNMMNNNNNNTNMMNNMNNINIYYVNNPNINLINSPTNINSMNNLNIYNMNYPNVNMLKNNFNNNNEIRMKLKINKEDINKKIYFLDNTYDLQHTEFQLSYKNLKELNNLNIKIYINNINCDFQRYFIPIYEGIYSIKIKFAKSITDCSYMFNECGNIIELDLSSFDTKNVTNMSYMFNGCNNLYNINLSSFNTIFVRDMNHMFAGCRNLNMLNLSSFNTLNVTIFSNMFDNCENLINIDLSSFHIQNKAILEPMFQSCNNLKKIKINKESEKKIKFELSRYFLNPEIIYS